MRPFLWALQAVELLRLRGDQGVERGETGGDSLLLGEFRDSDIETGLNVVGLMFA